MRDILQGKRHLVLIAAIAALMLIQDAARGQEPGPATGTDSNVEQGRHTG